MTLKTEEARLYVELGLIHVKQQRHEEALNDFTQAVNADPDNAQAHQHRGTLRVLTQDYEAAVQDLREAIRLEPSSMQAYFGLGSALAKLQDFSAALTCFNKASELGHPQAAQYAARLHQRLQEQPEPAAATPEPEPESEPLAPPIEAALAPPEEETAAPATPPASPPAEEAKSAEAYNDRGLQFLTKHQYEEALASFERAVEIDPGFAKAHFNAAGILNGQGDLEEALEHLKRAVQLGYEPAKQLAAEVYRKLKQGGDREETPEALLQSAAKVLAKFARAHCGADREMVQRTERGVFGVGERQVTRQEVRWSVEMANKYEVRPDGSREEVPGVELNLQQTPRALVRVTVQETKAYKVRIMAEEKIHRNRTALIGKVAETVDANPQQLLALLNSLLQRGVLVKEENFLRYAGAQAQS